MNKREESKIRTRALILSKTKELVVEKGVLGLTTLEIAKRCMIAHGSIFQHFTSREGLINTLLEEEIKRMAAEIEGRCECVEHLEGLLESYIEILSREEDFLSMLYRELPFLPEKIQRDMIMLEAIFRNDFFLFLKEKMQGKMGEKDITIRLDAFFSTVIRYLSIRQMYSPDGRVMRAKSDDIKKLFRILFEREDEK